MGSSDSGCWILTVRGVDRAPMGFAEPGDVLTLERETDNEADPNAVRVMVSGRPAARAHLGYIAREETELLAGVDVSLLRGSVRFPLNPVEQVIDVVGVAGVRGAPSE